MAAPRRGRKRPAPARDRGPFRRGQLRGSQPGRWPLEASRQFSDAHGRRLTFARYTPPAAPRQGMPLVVMLHGCRQTALAFARGSRMNQWADAGGFMVLYPQQSMTRQVQRCWRWFQPDALHGGAEADLIAALIRAEVARHGLDPQRVYIAGLSAGAGMAALVAMRHPR
ncbi:PHB depolymerase family esterase [Achromobacter xylosoxidans]